MKRRLFVVLIVALTLTALTGAASAQQAGSCFGDPSRVWICYLSGLALDVTRVDSNGVGVHIGTFPGEVFPYAAANLDSPTYMTRITGGDGSAADLYFTGKIPLGDGGYNTTWSIVVFAPGGGHWASQDFSRRASPAAVTLPFTPSAAPASGRTGGAAAAPAPYTGTTVTYSGEYEPAIVQQGSVAECLVRNTFTVRMREAPSTTAPIVGLVPYNTSMPADMKTADGGWVRSFFVGEGGVGHLGWVSASYLNLSDACAGLTLVAPIAGQVASAAPAPAAPAPARPAGQAPEATPTAFDPTFGGQIDLSIVVPGTVNNCLVRTTFTVRMRAAPSTSAPVVENVPYRTSMPADLRTTDDGWIRANYLGTLGWVDSSFLALSDACAGLAAISPMP